MNTTNLAASLVRAAATYTGLDANIIISKTRLTAAVEARWTCWVVMREHGLTLMEIGEAFGGRDHGTIIHGLRRAKDDLGNRDAVFRELCRAVSNHQTNPA